MDIEDKLLRLGWDGDKKRYLRELVLRSALLSFAPSLFVHVAVGDARFTILSYLLAASLSSLAQVKMLDVKLRGLEKEIDRDLVFALRHLCSELATGRTLHAAFMAVSSAGYGRVCKEFRLAALDMERGLTEVETLKMVMNRTPSRKLADACSYLISSALEGYDIPRSLEKLIERQNQDLKNRMEEFETKVSGLSIVYIFSAIILPALVIFLNAGGAFVLGLELPVPLQALLFIFVFPVASMLIFYEVQKSNPRL